MTKARSKVPEPQGAKTRPSKRSRHGPADDRKRGAAPATPAESSSARKRAPGPTETRSDRRSRARPAAKAADKVLIPEVIEVDLAAISEQIEEMHSRFVSTLRTSLRQAQAVGSLLLRVKEQLGHGKLEAWVAENCSFSARTARVYMQLAGRGAILPQEFEANRQGTAELTLEQSLRRLCKPQSRGRSQGDKSGRSSSSKTSNTSEEEEADPAESGRATTSRSSDATEEEEADSDKQEAEDGGRGADEDEDRAGADGAAEEDDAGEAEEDDEHTQDSTDTEGEEDTEEADRSGDRARKFEEYMATIGWAIERLEALGEEGIFGDGSGAKDALEILVGVKRYAERMIPLVDRAYHRHRRHLMALHIEKPPRT